jgi:hypothetical protein
MSNQINISNLHVNGMAQNASINIGGVLHNSHTANVKLFGANFSMGDFSPSSSLIITVIQEGQNKSPSSSDNSQ